MNNTDILLTPSTHKRRANSFLSTDEYEIIIKKKHSHRSTADTADSLSRSDFVCSPIASKILFSDLMQTPEQTIKVAKDKLSALKVCQSSKKHKSAHLNSYEEIKKNYMSDPQDYVDTFKVVKFKSIKYKLNACMLVRNESDVENDFVCRLLRIIRPNKVDAKKILAFLEVQWYYRKNDLPKKYAYLLPHISSNEVFLSPHKDFIMIDCINGPCEILTLEAYDQLTSTSNNIFYTRAQYDTISKKLDPPAEQWNKHCICKTPMNPDLLYIQCDKCNGWYHTECIHLSLEEAEAAEEYVCMMCSGDPNVVLPKEFEFKNHYQHHRKRKNSHLHQKNNKKESTPAATPPFKEAEEDMKISENTMNTVSTLTSSNSENNKDLESDCNSRQSNPLFPNEVEFRACESFDDMKMEQALKSLDELFQTLDHSSGFKTSSRPIELSVINMENDEKNSVKMEIDFSAGEESEEEETILNNRMKMEEDRHVKDNLGLEPDFNLEEEECKEFFDNFDDHFGEVFPPPLPQDLDKVTRTRHEQGTFIM